MTGARAKILERLAANGRPQMWANESEAARLSGMCPRSFSRAVKSLELNGFPKRNPLNHKRNIEAILAFWNGPVNDDVAGGESGERAKENWG